MRYFLRAFWNAASFAFHSRSRSAVAAPAFNLSRRALPHALLSKAAAPAGPSVEEVSRQLRAAEQRIAELESALGRSAMETDFLKRCFKRAKLPFPNGPKA